MRNNREITGHQGLQDSWKKIPKVLKKKNPKIIEGLNKM